MLVTHIQGQKYLWVAVIHVTHCRKYSAPEAMRFLVCDYCSIWSRTVSQNVYDLYIHLIH